MLGQFGQLASLLRNAGKIKENMQEMNARLEAARYVGEAGGGQVCATVNGRSDLIEIKIDPELVTSGDVEMIEDLVCAAVTDATRQCREGVQKEMEQVTGGLNMQGMMDMFGGGGEPQP